MERMPKAIPAMDMPLLVARPSFATCIPRKPTTIAGMPVTPARMFQEQKILVNAPGGPRLAEHSWPQGWSSLRSGTLRLPEHRRHHGRLP